MRDMYHLLQPITVGSMEVKNRVVMPGMGTGFGIDEEGRVTSQLTEYFVERARGGTGLIVTGLAPVDPAGQCYEQIPIWDDKFLPALKKMASAVHKFDVKFGVELVHGGVQSHVEEPLGPSAVPAVGLTQSVPREMTKDEIKQCVKAFGRAAERVVRAGFDFVEIHGAHGYLIGEFLSPYFNRRTDEYGGNFEKRMRFALEVIREVRNTTRDRIPSGMRINGDDFLGEKGWTLTDACMLAPVLQEEGIAYISVSAGVYGTLHRTIAPMYEDQGTFVHFSEEVKRRVSIPVIAVGRIKDVLMADRIVREGKADLVAMGRAHIADPDMVEKASKGQIADIRPCLADCRGCIDHNRRQALSGGPSGISCVVNPRVGREYLLREVEGEKRGKAKRVLVAGAGCAGLEAARRAAFAGHKVLLCERKGHIGGQLKLAAMMPKRQEIGDIIQWFERQLSKLGVEIRLNTEVDKDLLLQINPDVLLIATGSLPEIPLGYVNGLDNTKEIELVTVDELLEDERVTGDNVLIVGGGQIGLQLADYLSEKHKRVNVTERGAHFAQEMADHDKIYLLERLAKKEVTRYRRINAIEILPTDEVWIVDDRGRTKLPGINTIVLASDRRPNIFLAEVAQSKKIETHIVGDARSIEGGDRGTVFANIADGYEVGRQI